MTEIRFKTIGTNFVEAVASAQTSDELFATLQEYCCITGDIDGLRKDLQKISLPEKKETATFQAAVYRIQIEQRNKVMNQKIMEMQDKEEVRAYLVKYLRREKKLPKITDYTLIAMGEYLKKGFGKPADFKAELCDYFGLKQRPEVARSVGLGIRKAYAEMRLRA